MNKPGIPFSPGAHSALVEVRNLSKRYDVSAPWLNRWIERKPRRWLQAVEDLSFEIPRGQTLALVGESGCGKSTVARLLLGLETSDEGQFHFDGSSVFQQVQNSQAYALRRRMQMIFQNPYRSLNPRWSVMDIVTEPMRYSMPGISRSSSQSRSNMRGQTVALLQSVGLREQDLEKYPHQLSGGQLQRIAIARALACQSEFLVCDEPTSALDVSVQAQVLGVMQRLQQERGLTYLFISHNLAVVKHISHWVGVMYLGRLVELAPKSLLFNQAWHPYTQLLLDAVPSIHRLGRERSPVMGALPDPLQRPGACPFHPRCPQASLRCTNEIPRLRRIGIRQIACHAADGREPSR